MYVKPDTGIAILVINILKSEGNIPDVHYPFNVWNIIYFTLCSKWKLSQPWYILIRKEGNVLFNDTLNTFYLRLYDVIHIVKNHSDSEMGNPLSPHELLFPNSSKLLYASSHRQDNTYHCLCYTSRGALAGTRNSSMGPSHEGSIRRPIAPWANVLTTELRLAPILMK